LLKLRALPGVVIELITSPISSYKSICYVLKATGYSQTLIADNNSSFLLTGGLGNQLFQIAASLSVSKGGELTANTSLGRPRVSKKRIAEAIEFEYPFNIKSDEKKFNWLASKAVGVCIRSGVAPRWYEKKFRLQALITSLSSLILSIYFRKLVHIQRGLDVGYSALRNSNRNNFLIGYFQSFRYMEENPELKNAMQSISLTHQSLEFSRLVAEIKIDHPIIVHIRLGDYLNESSFGVPGESYYRNALKVLTEKYPSTTIWIFSDDVVGAKNRFASIFPKNVRWVVSDLANSAETLELMRYGSAYIIANSTFSWWSAYLSHTDNAPVIAPAKWFKVGSDPKDLIPREWMLIDTDF
jgi:hypothetical protein